MKALARFAMLVFAAVAAVAPPQAGGWCDVLFKDAALEAEVVVLARVERSKGKGLGVILVDVLKGECDREDLTAVSAELEGHDVKHNDHVLLALDGERRLLSQSRGLGLCHVINVLPIRGGKLRNRDRVNYDSLDGTLTLDQLKQELRRDLEAPSRQATLSGG